MSGGVGVIAVHLGAGMHSKENKQKLSTLCSNVVSTGNVMLREGKSALDVVTHVVCLLENDPLTNAGYGSNLTCDGTVECDAGAMDGESLTFGGVGAVSGVRNPILVARQLCTDQLERISSANKTGLVAPSVLVGEGARRYASECGVQVGACGDGDLISTAALKSYRKVSKKVNKHRQQQHENSEEVTSNELGKRNCPNNELELTKNSVRTPSDVGGIKTNELSHTENVIADNTSVQRDDVESKPEDKAKEDARDNRADEHSRDSDFEDILEDSGAALDTVGAVCLDMNGNCAAAVSSGGLLMKHSGRVGHAPLFGCGCYADCDNQNHSGEKRRLAAAVSTSGCGEHISRVHLAKEIASALQNMNPDENSTTTVNKVFNETFLKSRLLAGVKRKLGGALILFSSASSPISAGEREEKTVSESSDDENSNEIELLWAHTTKTMVVGWMSTDQKRPHFAFSELPDGLEGKRVVVEGKHFSLM